MEPIIIVDGKVRRPTITDMLKALTPANHKLIEMFTDELESMYALSYVTSITRETLKYVIRLQNRGIENALDSTNKNIVDHCRSMESQSKVAKEQRIGYLRIFLHFLSVEQGLSPSLEMTASIFMYDKIVFIEELSAQKRHTFEAATKSDKGTSLNQERYWFFACKLCTVIKDLNYSFTTIHVLSRALRRFYVFLCANGLDYSPALACCWVKETIAPEMVS